MRPKIPLGQPRTPRGCVLVLSHDANYIFTVTYSSILYTILLKLILVKLKIVNRGKFRVDKKCFFVVVQTLIKICNFLNTLSASKWWPYAWHLLTKYISTLRLAKFVYLFFWQCYTILAHYNRCYPDQGALCVREPGSLSPHPRPCSSLVRAQSKTERSLGQKFWIAILGACSSSGFYL